MSLGPAINREAKNPFAVTVAVDVHVVSLTVGVRSAVTVAMNASSDIAMTVDAMRSVTAATWIEGTTANNAVMNDSTAGPSMATIAPTMHPGQRAMSSTR